MDYSENLYNALCGHGCCNLFKARNISACNIVAFHAVTLCGVIQVVEDIDHDALQLAVHLFEAPAETLAVLAHFQSGGCHAACICSLSGNEQNAVLLQLSLIHILLSAVNAVVIQLEYLASFSSIKTNQTI